MNILLGHLLRKLPMAMQNRLARALFLMWGAFLVWILINTIGMLFS